MITTITNDNRTYIHRTFILYLADGHWGSWETWQDCSKTCGTGSRLRTRHCNDPPALNGGEECAGSSFQREPCNDYPCTTTPAPGKYKLLVYRYKLSIYKHYSLL